MASKQDALRIALEEVVGCFKAAYIEGLADALAETTDERLKDLVERRLLYANAAAIDALSAHMGAAQPADAQPATATRCAHCGHMHATADCVWNHLRHTHPAADQPEDKPVAWAITSPEGVIDTLEDVHFSEEEGIERLKGCIDGCYLTPLSISQQPPKPAAQNNQEPTK